MIIIIILMMMMITMIIRVSCEQDNATGNAAIRPLPEGDNHSDGRLHISSTSMMACIFDDDQGFTIKS